MTSNILYILIPAAGFGSRMNSNISKQHLIINNQSILQHTINKFINFSLTNNIFVGLNNQDIDNIDSLPYLKHNNITIVEGGNERCFTVLNLLKASKQFHINHNVNKQAWVMIHDAARPLINHEDLNRLWQNRNDYGSILATKAKDTVKFAKDLKIEKTINRNNIWLAQTPQLFKLDFILDCLENAINDNINITDEASAVEYNGYQPELVESKYHNLKITTPNDLDFAKFIMKGIA